MISRRAFLATVGTAALAGCASFTESSEFRAFRGQIEDEGVDVEAMAEEERRWVMEYYPTGSNAEELLAELGDIAFIYSDTVPERSDDDAHRQLDLIILKIDGSRYGSVSIDAQMARDYRSGEITRNEYGAHILSSGAPA